MADATHININGRQVSGQTAKCTNPIQNMLEEGKETEPSEQIHSSEARITENVQQETGKAASSLFGEQLHPFSENMSKDSLPQILVLPSCPQVTTLEKAGPENTLETECDGELSNQHQPSSECVQNEPLGTVAAVGTCPLNKLAESSPGNLTSDSLSKEMELLREDVSINSQSGKTSCPKDVASEVKHDRGAGNRRTEPAETKHDVDSNLLQNETRKIDIAVSSGVLTEKCLCAQQGTLGQIKDFGCGCLLGETPKQDDHLCSGLVQNVPVETGIAASDCDASEHLEPPLGDASESHIDKQVERSEDVLKSSSLEQFEASSKSLVNKSSSLGRRDKRTSKSREKKYMLRSLVSSDRVLRSRTQEKPKSLESSNSLSNVGNGVDKRMKERKKRRGTRIVDDEFTRIRRRLRYFLNRIHYEQNLIDAYSSEGWKGNSLEKLKPEKELQRAKTEIFRRKLKIRDLFQQLDSLCAGGRFPKSLFDSEGQIDSEDIYCAKCGSKDLSANNDILLCDGACDRGFHQFCLEPPLLSEDIPPDDEGWLCPGCDCKVDCFDLLNDSHGTNLSITDSWEKVFPEAAAAAREGKDQDPNLEFPSDDSDDDDYDPDGPGTVEKVGGDESSSDESEYASACEELEGEASPKDEQQFGLSSDDSEDNDYDPDAPDLNENAKQESSSSDFTSDSEDLVFTLDDGQFSEKDDVNMSSSLDPKAPLGKSQSSKHGGNKSSIKEELLEILDSGTGHDGSPPISGKRKVERLDYKRLHDETYGNVPSDSSDDEDWTDNGAPRKRKKTIGRGSSVSPNGNASIIKNVTTMDAANYNLEDNEQVARRRSRQTSMVTNENNSPNKSVEGSPKTGSTGKRLKSSTYRRLGEAVTQRLFKSFKENQYPDRAAKQSLAQELEITPQQVSKWFENMRWSYRHSSGKEPGISESVSKESAVSSQTDNKLVESEQNTNITRITCNGAPNEELPGTGNAMLESCSGNVGGGKAEMPAIAKESSGQESITPSSKKKRGRPRQVDRPETPPVVDIHETGGRKRGRWQNSTT